jgi:hypothetical protein
MRGRIPKKTPMTMAGNSSIRTTRTTARSFPWRAVAGAAVERAMAARR